MFASSPSEKLIDERPALDVLLIELAGELYAIPSSCVREVIRYRPFTHVPGAPATLPGVLSQRGLILPLVDLRPILGLEMAEVTRTTRLVVATHQDADMALLVEAVLDLMSLPADTVQLVPTALDPARARFIRGIAQHNDQPIALLDLDEVIAGLRAWS